MSKFIQEASCRLQIESQATIQCPTHGAIIRSLDKALAESCPSESLADGVEAVEDTLAEYFGQATSHSNYIKVARLAHARSKP